MVKRTKLNSKKGVMWDTLLYTIYTALLNAWFPEKRCRHASSKLGHRKDPVNVALSPPLIFNQQQILLQSLEVVIVLSTLNGSE